MLRLALCSLLILGVAACGTRLNPFNWFGGERETRIAVVETAEVADPRTLVAEVVSLSVEAVPTGAIVQAMGRPPTQGYWEAELVEVERTDTSLVYEFRLLPPFEPTPAGTPRSREVIVATSLSQFDLAGIRTITVIGAENRRSVSRR